jgi:hydroxymethylpyrimidine pyrophosphatase-like HAD family hydrolase
MFYLEGSQVVYCDVDDTLLFWDWPTSDTENTITLEPWNDGDKVRLTVNLELIEQLRKHSARGHPIVVWSQGGFLWAKTVVEALGLQKYVSVIMEKPTWVYDDLPCNEFMP